MDNLNKNYIVFYNFYVATYKSIYLSIYLIHKEIQK